MLTSRRPTNYYFGQTGNIPEAFSTSSAALSTASSASSVMNNIHSLQFHFFKYIAQPVTYGESCSGFESGYSRSTNSDRLRPFKTPLYERACRAIMGVSDENTVCNKYMQPEASRLDTVGPGGAVHTHMQTGTGTRAPAINKDTGLLQAPRADEIVLRGSTRCTARTLHRSTTYYNMIVWESAMNG